MIKLLWRSRVGHHDSISSKMPIGKAGLRPCVSQTLLLMLLLLQLLVTLMLKMSDDVTWLYVISHVTCQPTVNRRLARICRTLQLMQIEHWSTTTLSTSIMSLQRKNCSGTKVPGRFCFTAVVRRHQYVSWRQLTMSWIMLCFRTAYNLNCNARRVLLYL